MATDTQSAEQDHFDLLPFIAIMMCLLGTLLLVTMSMAAINIGAGAGEGWMPESTSGSKTPVLIEWDGKAAIWHNEKTQQRIEADFIEYRKLRGNWFRIGPDDRLTKVAAPEPTAIDPLIDYLEKRRQSHYALFAVRPGGFENFRRLAVRFEDHGIEIGSEPIDAGKPVRLVLPAGTVK